MMKNIFRILPFSLRSRGAPALAMLLAVSVPFALLLPVGCASGNKANSAKPGERTAAPDSSTNAPASSARKLSGAELYSMNCNRCHQERYPTERTAAQWRTVLLHMRIRANLPDEQAQTILQYLQDNSGR